MSNDTKDSVPSIFISYRIADTLQTADRLAVELKRKFGADEVFFDRRTIEAGDAWPERIETAVKGAAVVLVVIGKKWLTVQNEYGRQRLDVPGDWVRLEVEAALANARSVIPLLVDGASAPRKEALAHLSSIAKLASCQGIPLRTAGRDWDNDFAALVALLASKGLSVLTAASEQARHRTKPMNLPYPSLGTLLKGREGLLADIRAGFEGKPGQAQVIVARHAIHGLGGIGKTRAAVEYAWRHVEDYRALLFVTAQSPQDLHTKLAALCYLLGLAEDVTEENARVQAALTWLADPANRPWLLIADNVDTAEAAQAVDRTLANLTGGHLLITGRLSEWPSDVRALPVNVLDPDPARDFLLERTDGKRSTAADDPDHAETLAEELGYLALALEQAAAYIRRRAMSFAEYLALWQAADQKVLQWHDARTMQYERPLATTWQTSIEALPPTARALLDLLAWLAPEPLPRFLFDHTSAPEGTEHLFEGGEHPREILGRLCGEPDADPLEGPPWPPCATSSLLQPAKEGDFPSEGQVHRVLALITRERQSGEARAAALKVALALVDAAAVGDPQDVRSWPVREPLEAHVRLLVDHAELGAIPAPTTTLLNDLGMLLHAKAQHIDAEFLYRRALAIDEASYGPEHPNVSRDLSNFAQLLLSTNRREEAEPLMRRALAIDEAIYGPEHPRVALVLNNLAQVLRNTNRWAEAETSMRRAVEIFEASLGPEHPDVAVALNNLAKLCGETNRLVDAEALMNRELVILLKFTRKTGHRHPRLQKAFDNYRKLLPAMGMPKGKVKQRIASLGSKTGFVPIDFHRLLKDLKAGT